MLRRWLFIVKGATQSPARLHERLQEEIRNKSQKLIFQDRPTNGITVSTYLSSTSDLKFK
jgi:hypothetical protein